MKLPRRNFLRLAAGAAALPVLPRIARAQAYPSRPVQYKRVSMHSPPSANLGIKLQNPLLRPCLDFRRGA
jgi:hypothetical protein